MEISDKDLKELRRIHDSIPEEWKKRVTVKQKVSPTVEWAVKKAIDSGELTAKKKNQFQNVLDSGVLSQEEDVENTKVTKKIDEYLKREMAKSIRAGRLSKPPKKK